LAFLLGRGPDLEPLLLALPTGYCMLIRTRLRLQSGRKHARPVLIGENPAGARRTSTTSDGRKSPPSDTEVFAVVPGHAGKDGLGPILTWGRVEDETPRTAAPPSAPPQLGEEDCPRAATSAPDPVEHGPHVLRRIVNPPRG